MRQSCLGSAEMPGKTKVVYEFGPFRLDVSKRILQRDGRMVPLSPKALDTLVLLVRHRDEILDKQTMMERLWGNVSVDESNLTQQIFNLRKALDDRGNDFIETVPRRGYRFVANVVEHKLDGNGEAVTQDAKANTAIDPAQESAKRSGGSLAGVPIKWKSAAVVTVALAMTLAVVYWLSHSEHTSTIDRGPIRSVAVLPLENLSGDVGQRYFADGITEAITGDLAQVDSLRVISRSSAMQYRESRKTVPEIARELHVDGIVEGTVSRSGDRVRVTAELLDARSDSHLWAQSYDRDVRDILSLQSELAADIAQQVAAKLTAQQRRALGKKRVVDPAAHEAYLKGRFVWNERTEHSYLEAIRLFNEALSHDPGYADAYAGLADAYALLGSLPSTAITRTEAMEKARAAALRAIELDPDLAEAHTSLAFVLMHYDWKFADAQKEFQIALQLNPNYATAHQWYAYDLIAMGRTEESLEENRRAQQNDPLSLIIAADRAELLLDAGRMADAERQIEEVLSLNPNFPLAHFTRATLYSKRGDSKLAIAEADKAAELTHHGIGAELLRAYVAARSGDRATALRIVNQFSGQAQRVGSCYPVALVYMGLGNSEDAYLWLGRAFQQREGSLILLRVDPDWNEARSDPRFVELLQRVGYTPS